MHGNTDDRYNSKIIAPLQGSEAATLQEIHLINLDVSTERLEAFTKRNSHLGNVLRISAIDGAAVDRAHMMENGLIREDLVYSPGALGCALSHLGLWRKAASENRIVTVFEDDTICALDFLKQSKSIVERLPPDWDIVHWGFVFQPLFLWLDLGFSKAKLEFYDRRCMADVQEFQIQEVPRTAWRLAHSFGTQAYSVSAKGAQALLDGVLPLRKQLIGFPGTGIVIDNLGIDCAMCGVYPSIQAFVCIPPMVIHDQVQASDRLARPH